MSLKKVIRGHCKEDILILASAYEEHRASRVKAEHRMFSLERKIWFVKIHFKGKPMCRWSVREQCREPDRISDGEMIVYHTFIRIHKNLTSAHRKTKLVIDLNGVSGGQEVHHVRVSLLIQGLQLRQLQHGVRCIVEPLFCGFVAEGGSNDFTEDRGLSYRIIRICCQLVRDDGYVRGVFSLLRCK